jgi:hypothetical protein
MILYFTQKSTGHNDKGIETVYPWLPKAYDSIPDQCYSNCLPRNPGLGFAGVMQAQVFFLNNKTGKHKVDKL